MNKILLISLGLISSTAYAKQVEIVSIPLSIETNHSEEIAKSTTTITIPDNDRSVYSGAIGVENRKADIEAYKQKYPEKFDKDGTYKGSSFLNKKIPKVGMTASELLESTWGKPFSKRSTESKYGISETWDYRSLGSITLHNGKVEFIHRRE